MGDGCNLHDTCFRCEETNWGFPDCPNHIAIAKREAMEAFDALFADKPHRKRSVETVSAREERVRRGRAFQKARKPSKEK